MTRKPYGPRNANRIAYLRFKLEMLSKWRHQLEVEWRCADREFQKLTLAQPSAASSPTKQEQP